MDGGGLKASPGRLGLCHRPFGPYFGSVSPTAARSLRKPGSAVVAALVAAIAGSRRLPVLLASLVSFLAGFLTDSSIRRM